MVSIHLLLRSVYIQRSDKPLEQLLCSCAQYATTICARSTLGCAQDSQIDGTVPSTRLRRFCSTKYWRTTHMFRKRKTERCVRLMWRLWHTLIWSMYVRPVGTVHLRDRIELVAASVNLNKFFIQQYFRRINWDSFVSDALCKSINQLQFEPTISHRIIDLPTQTRTHIYTNCCSCVRNAKPRTTTKISVYFCYGMERDVFEMNTNGGVSVCNYVPHVP